MLFKVTVADKSTNVRIYKDSVVDDYTTAEYYEGGYHNYHGLKGYAIEKAIQKLYGKNAYWFGNADAKDYGQVFESLKQTKYNSNPGSTSRTKFTYITVMEVK